jgi:hypothetical protein
LQDAAESADTSASTAGNGFELATNVLLAVLLLVGLLAFCVSVVVGSRKSMRGHYCVSSNCLNLMLLLFLILAIICSAYLLLLRLSAGFCDDPIGIMVRSLKQNNDTAASYYTQVCAPLPSPRVDSLLSLRRV